MLLGLFVSRPKVMLVRHHALLSTETSGTRGGKARSAVPCCIVWPAHVLPVRLIMQGSQLSIFGFHAWPGIAKPYNPQSDAILATCAGLVIGLVGLGVLVGAFAIFSWVKNNKKNQRDAYMKVCSSTGPSPAFHFKPDTSYQPFSTPTQYDRGARDFQLRTEYILRAYLYAHIYKGHLVQQIRRPPVCWF